jgi:hypothetical protein
MRCVTLAVFSALVVVGSVTGCLQGVELIKPPEKATGDLSFHLRADPEDAATAAALGWQGGIPGARLTLMTSDSAANALVAMTNSAGMATFANVEIGHYQVEATRWLSPAERVRLSANDDALGFALMRANVDAIPEVSVPVTVPASRRRALVISEFSFSGTNGYDYGGYLELFNNADTTVYLDGMMLSRALDVAADYPNFPCSMYTHITSDSTSLWARQIEAFPGRGQDYPLAPGQTAVFATDAIDHRPLWKHGLDLSNATFESIGKADVDNPAVPNMINHGTVTQDHGLKFFDLANVVVLIRASDVSSFQKSPVPGSSYEWYRIPAAEVLDVLWLRSSYVDPAYPECPRLVSPRFDRAGADMRSSDENVKAERSISRRTIPELSSTRRILQHTRTGRADFVLTPRTPGTVP